MPPSECDLLIIGGGLTGICAAIQAGRLGLRTVLVEKEWCLGGNGGPLLGVHWGGVGREQPGWNETGIIEELTQLVAARNSYHAGVAFNSHPGQEELFTEVLQAAGVIILRRYVTLSAATAPTAADRRRITSVRLLNLENLEQSDLAVTGFAVDCSGDAALAALAGAETVMGREARSDTHERSAREQADAVVAASSITALTVDTGVPRPFVPPAGTPPWNPEKPANQFRPERRVNMLFQVDAGGGSEHHPLHTPQELYQRLRLHIYSMWDYHKNVQFQGQAQTHELIWISPLIGRRETRRVVGDYRLDQDDLETGRTFPDDVAFSGCGLDFHPPSLDGGYETIFFSRALLHGIPLRSLYSRNVENLFCAGRNISTTHVAQSGIRLIRTCGIMGQAVAVAASHCLALGKSPRALAPADIEAIQQTLLRHDALVLDVTNADAQDLARRARVCASSEASLSGSLGPAPRWLSAHEGLGIALYAYPELITQARIYVRNPGPATVVTLACIYHEIPRPAWPEVNERRPDERYEFRVPHPPARWQTISEQQCSVAAGFSGWLDLPLPAGGWPLPPYTRLNFAQAACLTIRGAVEIAEHQTFLGVERGLRWADDTWQEGAAVPLVAISPEPLPGAAAHLIDGHLHREGLARLHQWVAALPGEQWIELQWSQVQSIAVVVVRLDTTRTRHRDDFNPPGTCLADYRIEAWNGQTWSDVVAVAGNALRVREHRLATAVTTDRLRLVALRMQDPRQPARVQEIRVYAG